MSFSQETNIQETRKFITPYAFRVSSELLGRRLASPSKRAVAIAIDLLLIALVATLSGFVLLAVVGVLSTFHGLKLLRRGERHGQSIAELSVGLICILVAVLVLVSNAPSEPKTVSSDTYVEEQKPDKILAVEAAVDRLTGSAPENAIRLSKQDDENDAADTASGPSLLAWVQGVVSDLGLSFGWAAVYFTAFVAWMNGQTPGKKVVGTQVIRVDGKRLSLWDSFGRYGGYGAGFATGLLGFLQVYWDQNRQAIQDKIAETMVVDLRKPNLTIDQAPSAPDTRGVYAQES